MVDRKQLCVLVVDDSLTQRTMLRHYLAARGYRVVEATGGLEATKKLCEVHPDAVLLDWQLPDVQGPELLEQWGKHPEHRWIPVLMVTAHHEADRIEHALDRGAVDFLRKPTEAVELHARLRSALRIKSLQDELRELADRDSLTGVFNRRVFLDRLRAELARAGRHKHDFSVAILDIDHFKRINDGHGHEVGDLVLVQVARYLVANLRVSDTLARYGGEEFVVLLPETPLAAAHASLDRLRAGAGGRPWGKPETHLTVTFSGGVCSLRESDASTAEALIATADASLYEAKATGRNRILAAPRREP